MADGGAWPERRALRSRAPKFLRPGRRSGPARAWARMGGPSPTIPSPSPPGSERFDELRTAWILLPIHGDPAPGERLVERAAPLASIKSPNSWYPIRTVSGARSGRTAPSRLGELEPVRAFGSALGSRGASGRSRYFTVGEQTSAHDVAADAEQPRGLQLVPIAGPSRRSPSALARRVRAGSARFCSKSSTQRIDRPLPVAEARRRQRAHGAGLERGQAPDRAARRDSLAGEQRVVHRVLELADVARPHVLDELVLAFAAERRLDRGPAAAVELRKCRASGRMSPGRSRSG